VDSLSRHPQEGADQHPPGGDRRAR
jgi:hypothetical protein